MNAPKRVYASGWIRAIAEATDHDTAMKVALAFGGRRVRIPVTATPGCQLAEAVGQEAAEALAEKLGNTTIQVGLEKTNLVFWLRDRGNSVPDIAHTLRMATRSVQYVLNDNMPKRPEGTVFPDDESSDDEQDIRPVREGAR